MTDLRQRTAEMLAYESNPSREEWRKLVEELELDRNESKELGALHERNIALLNNMVMDERARANLSNATLAAEILKRAAFEALVSELWTLRMMRMSCSVMTAQQSSEYAARSDAAWADVQRVLEGK